MESIDALARAIKAFEGGVVIVSHDFRQYYSLLPLYHHGANHIPASILTIVLLRSGLISQVAEELWEVKDKTIKNLTKDDITIVDYKKILVKHSEYSFALRHSLTLASDPAATSIADQRSPSRRCRNRKG